MTYSERERESRSLKITVCNKYVGLHVAVAQIIYFPAVYDLAYCDILRDYWETMR